MEAASPCFKCPFLALYWVLYESVELRQAPFLFWIQDLAAIDPISFFFDGGDDVLPANAESPTPDPCRPG